jgi:hypothetical protein
MEDKKQKYEPPKAMRLDGRHLGKGDCFASGSGDMFVCYESGSSAGDICDCNGNAAGLDCMPGFGVT